MDSRIIEFIHSRNVCQKEVITFNRLWEEEESRLIRREEEGGSNWRSSSHHSKKIPQAMTNVKNSILEEHLIHLIIWIRNDDVINEEDDEVEGSRRSLPTKRIKDKYSIVIAWYCFVMHLIIFSWCIMHDRLFALMIV